MTDIRWDKHRLEGWTFVEAIAVLAITIILSGVVAVSAGNGIERAKRAAVRMEMQAISLGLHAYLADTGQYPSGAQGLAALFRRPTLAPVPTSWRGPYVNAPVSRDPWGGEYIYRVPGPDGLPFELRSLGPDGLPGGTGNDSDISSTGSL